MNKGKAGIIAKGEQTSSGSGIAGLRCPICKRTPEQITGRSISPVRDPVMQSFFDLMKPQNTLCISCHMKSSKKRQKLLCGAQDPGVLLRPSYENQIITAPIPRTAKSHNCCVCEKKKDRKNKNPEFRFKAVPKEARYQVYERKKIFIPKNTTCCEEHFNEKLFKDDDLDRIKIFANETSFNLTEFVEMKERFGDDFPVEVNADA